MLLHLSRILLAIAPVTGFIYTIIIITSASRTVYEKVEITRVTETYFDSWYVGLYLIKKKCFNFRCEKAYTACALRLTLN